jgi:hypothetical protein
MGTITDPASVGVAVTPSDTVNISADSMRCRGIYVGTGGSLSILMDNGSVTFANVPTGSLLPIRTRRVNSTGTTATDLVALF